MAKAWGDIFTVIKACGFSFLGRTAPTATFYEDTGCPAFHRQVILRGVGHAALHDPGEVNLCSLLQSSVIYDRCLLHRTTQSKEAKKASKRWQKAGGVVVLQKHIANTEDPRYLPVDSSGGCPLIVLFVSSEGGKYV